MENNIQFSEICQLLRLQKQFSDAYDNWIARAGNRLGLSKPEADVLLFLANNPEYNTARDVVANRALSKTYVSKAVDQLATRKFLHSSASTEDRRLQYLKLTPDALLVARNLRQAQADFFRRLGNGLSPEEMSALRRALGKVQHNVGRIR